MASILSSRCPLIRPRTPGIVPSTESPNGFPTRVVYWTTETWWKGRHGVVGSILEQVAGAAVILLVLLDVFRTVLYPRAGTGIVSRRLSRTVWWLFRHLATQFGRRRPIVMAFCGPAILVLLVILWALMLTVGSALVIQP